MQKRFSLLFSVSAAALFLASMLASASPVSVSISVFHDQLAPHGRWTRAASFGDVWIPAGVATGWQPYVDGEWVYTDYGWTWVSDDSWGDVPYHYGTWAWVDPYGWVWVPGTVWAPAWVTWAYTDEYVGWAPVPPSFVLSARGYSGSAVVIAPTRYIFVPAHQFVGVRVSTVRIPAARNATIFPHAVKTTRFEVSHGIVRTAGPPTARIEKAIGRPVERVSVQRLRSQPTTLEAAGVTNAKSIRVAAPAAAGRGREATTQESAGKKTAGAPNNAAKQSREPRPERAGAPTGNRTQASDRAQAPATESSKRVKPPAKKPEPAAANRPESSAKKPESSAKKSEPRARSSHPKDAEANAPPDRPARVERPESPPPQARPAEEHPPKPPDRNPREAPPKEKPPEKPPQL